MPQLRSPRAGQAGPEEREWRVGRIEERRAQHQRYKEDVQREGKAFFPHAMFHDTVMSLVVVSVIIGLACVWYFTAEGSDDPGWLGPHYTEEADPGTTDFIPRPDWFFYFLFYLLRIFKWPDTVVLGTVGVPNILLSDPDRPSVHRPAPRAAPVAAAGRHQAQAIVVVLAMGTLTYKGATAKEALGSELVEAVPAWAEQQGFAGDEEAVAGAEIFAQAGCGQCHVYLGTGARTSGRPISDVGASDRGAEYFANYVSNPAQFGNNVMLYAGLGEENLAKLGAFLDASKGPKE